MRSLSLLFANTDARALGRRYTSEPAYASMLAPSDTPHGAWLHVAVWFARGGTAAQACAFGATAVLAAAFAAGVGAGPLGPTSVLLWLAVTAMHGRCEAVCDGADHYLRAVLLWCMLLPMDRALSLRATCARLRSHAGSHARARTRKRAHASVGEGDVSEADDGGEGAEGPIVRGYAVCGLCLQMCFMYWGTVMHRWEGQRCARAHTQTQAYARARTRPCTRAPRHTRMHVHANLRKHERTRALAHARTRSRAQLVAAPPGRCVLRAGVELRHARVGERAGAASALAVALYDGLRGVRGGPRTGVASGGRVCLRSRARGRWWAKGARPPSRAPGRAQERRRKCVRRRRLRRADGARRAHSGGARARGVARGPHGRHAACELAGVYLCICFRLRCATHVYVHVRSRAYVRAR